MILHLHLLGRPAWGGFIIKSGRGIVLISTSKGIMTGREAKKQHLGGEILIKVY